MSQIFDVWIIGVRKIFLMYGKQGRNGCLLVGAGGLGMVPAYPQFSAFAYLAKFSRVAVFACPAKFRPILCRPRVSSAPVIPPGSGQKVACRRGKILPGSGQVLKVRRDIYTPLKGGGYICSFALSTRPTGSFLGRQKGDLTDSHIWTTFHP